jgi:tripartite-type tricarboxylate transporter receptor subunit TctC
LCCLASPVHAQSYPARPVRVIVPFAPGGGTDIIARVMAPRLAEALGQQVVVDNRPGGGTIIGAELAARSPPDGYTLFMGLYGTMAINPSLYRKLPYDPVRDFAPVTLVGVGPNVLVVHPSLPAKSVKELIALAKAHPGKLSYASSGTGGAPHLAGELFKAMAHVDMVHVPYKGAGPATIDLLAGHVQVMFAGLGPAIAHVRAGKLHALGVASARRTPALPRVPTIAETLPGFEASSWFGVFVPAGTPQAVIARLNADIAKVMARKDVQEPLMAQGYEALTGTPEELRGLLKRDIARWASVIRDARITAD